MTRVKGRKKELNVERNQFTSKEKKGLNLNAIKWTAQIKGVNNHEKIHCQRRKQLNGYNTGPGNPRLSFGTK